MPASRAGRDISQIGVTFGRATVPMEHGVDSLLKLSDLPMQHVSTQKKTFNPARCILEDALFRTDSLARFYFRVKEGGAVYTADEEVA